MWATKTSNIPTHFICLNTTGVSEVKKGGKCPLNSYDYARKKKQFSIFFTFQALENTQL